jgi:Domain of unknown function DUF29
MSDLYDTDILAWSEHQADLLRRIAAGEPVNERPDWTNLIEEIEDVGKGQLHAVESAIVLALRHMLEAEAWPLSLTVPHWQAEARLFRRQARRSYTPGMRQKINMADLYADALAAMPETVDGVPPLPVPAVCPVTLDELLSDAA